MHLLQEMEGISGFRWGAMLQKDGSLLFSDKAPEVDHKKILLLARLLSQSSLRLKHAHLLFDLGKVLIRKGAFGFMLIFCDDTINVSMIDIVLDAEMNRSGPPSNPSLDSDVDSKLSIVTTIDLGQGTVPAHVIEELLDLYSEYLGPLARALAGKDARENGIDLANLSTRNWPKLLNLMANRFDSQSKREDFLDRAVLFKAKF